MQKFINVFSTRKPLQNCVVGTFWNLFPNYGDFFFHPTPLSKFGNFELCKCFFQEFLFLAKVVIIHWKQVFFFFFFFLVPILWFQGEFFFLFIRNIFDSTLEKRTFPKKLLIATVQKFREKKNPEIWKMQ
jgi:hypothetical protein